MSLPNRIANLFRRNKLQREIDAELCSHIELRIEDNLAAGMSLTEARRDAMLRFGNRSAMRERTTEADSALYLESLFGDLRYALRQLRRDPAFALTSILILSLGIGACTAIFSAIKPILLDPLPYPHASRIAMLWERSADGSPAHVSFGTFQGLLQRSHAFDSIAVMKPWQPAIVATTATDTPERLEGQRVSADFFRTLGIAPKIGRDFQAADDVLHGPAVIILSDRLWHRRFAADPSIVGKQLRLEDTFFTVIGIMPPSFEDVLLPTAELWAPLQYDPSLPADGREWGHHLRMIGRLRNGIAAEQASSEAAGILRLHAQIYAKGYASSGGPPNGLIVKGLQHDLTSGVRPALLAVLGAVLLVLSIACVNVTNLVLARAAQRRAEFAMRAALGAARGRLIRQLLTESLLLALFSGALGMAIAVAGVRALIALSPPDLPRLSAIAVNGSMFLFAFAITALTGTLVGLVPAIEAAHADPARGLQQGSRRTAGSRHLPRRILVIAEVSLAVVLLIGAGLLLRSMTHLFAIDPGFDAPQLLSMQVQESGRQYESAAARLRFFDLVLERVRHLPGVLSTGLTSQLPLSGDVDGYGVQFENGPQAEAAYRYAITPGYLETMHIPLRRGRTLNKRDIAGAPMAVLLNEGFANRIFPAGNALGQRVRLGGDMGHSDRPWATVVGIVGDVKQVSLGDTDQDAFYIATSQWAWTDEVQSLVVRTQGPPAALTSLIRDAIWSVDKNLPIVRVATMDNLLAASESERHFVLMLFEAFALVGLILAATGTYGVLSGSVTERTREIGVRAALGASRGSILVLVMRQGMALAASGVLIGLGIAMIASRAISALLFDVSRLDLLTYLGVAALLLAVSCVACFVPARRAASINPVDALRAE